MNLEDKVENEINDIEAAKIIMPYLKVNPVKLKLNNKLKYVPFFFGVVAWQGILSAVEGIHTAYLFCTSRESYQEKRRNIKREEQNIEIEASQDKKKEKEFQEFLSNNGINEYAFAATRYIGGAFKDIIFSGENIYLPIEITKSRPKLQDVIKDEAWTLKEVGKIPLEIRTQKQSFELLLEFAIKDAIFLLEDHFYGNIPGFSSQFNNVELDMASIKKELLDRIYQKCSKGKPVKLIDNVVVRIEQEYVHMGWYSRNS